MSPKTIAAAVMAATTFAVAVAPAAAETYKRTHRSDVARHDRRVVVTRRSYLDPGTEVLPGSQNYTQYVYSRGFYNHHPEYGDPGSPIYNGFFPISSSFFPYWW
jgi:hypothetical protein